MLTRALWLAQMISFALQTTGFGHESDELSHH